MSVINKLASAQGRRDDVPNQELAKELVATKSIKDIQELVANLRNQNRNIQSDCIKVLYEIGYLAPELIAEFAGEFLALLESKNNRMVWGGMIALSTIAPLQADNLFEHREKIKKAIEKGSVIVVDRGIKTLAIVAAHNEEYCHELFPYLLNHLANCRPKDVPRDAEAILVAVNTENKMEFIEKIRHRMEDMRPPQIKRLNKVIAAAEKR